MTVNTPSAPLFQPAQSHADLTPAQQDAFKALVRFLNTPDQPFFVLKGYAGTGKTFLVNQLLHDFPKLQKMMQLLHRKNHTEQRLTLTATTNKAAQAMAVETGESVKTIYSFMHLRVEKNYDTGKTGLVSTGDPLDLKDGDVIVVDEASYLGKEVLDYITKQLRNNKVIFMGDPAQLPPIKEKLVNGIPPCFQQGWPEVELTEIIRQSEGNQIIDLAAGFRDTVSSGKFFVFEPNDVDILHLDKVKFGEAIRAEFSRSDWNYHDSKILCWRNQTVHQYNAAVDQMKSKVAGQSAIEKDEWVANNRYLRLGRRISIATDALVKVTDVTPYIHAEFGIHGFKYRIEEPYCEVFMPETPQGRAKAIVAAKAATGGERRRKLAIIEEEWADLRKVYSCTINKSQGSTYDKVFLDLNDLRGQRNENLLARLLYVACSRPRKQLILTGDIR